jgi:protocatechuate 3,4-dioxygenase beta subunit
MTDTHDPLRSLGRRRALQLLGGAGLAALAACAGKAGDGAATATTAATSAASATTAATSAASAGTSAGSSAGGAIPEETAGPYPGDGSNGPDVLDDAGIVRRDITAGYGSSSGVADGVPLTIELAIVDADGGDPRPGAAVYVWHCDRAGGYSQYGDLQGENYLRGVQAAGDDGVVRFTSIFPAAYSGRWPHIHLEVYDDVDAATGGGSPVATSQVALPEDTCDAVYATDGYEQSVTNMSRTSLASDMVFGDDGAAHQLATMSGSVAGGLTARLEVPV